MGFTVGDRVRVVDCEYYANLNGLEGIVTATDQTYRYWTDRTCAVAFEDMEDGAGPDGAWLLAERWLTPVAAPLVPSLSVPDPWIPIGRKIRSEA